MNRLKELRESHGMKQSELGKLLNVQDAAISKYEAGKIPLTADTIIKLSEIFQVSTDYLLGLDDPRSDGAVSAFGYHGEEENATSFPHKLALQIDFKGTKIQDLAKGIGVTEKTILNWLSGTDDNYSDYYQQLSDFFKVQVRYWTSPHALSPGIEPDIDEYLLILLYREYKETGILNKLYGSLEYYFPNLKMGVKEDTMGEIEKKYVSLFRKLNEVNRDIIIGDMQKYIKEQKQESAAVNEPFRKVK